MKAQFAFLVAKDHRVEIHCGSKLEVHHLRRIAKFMNEFADLLESDDEENEHESEQEKDT